MSESYFKLTLIDNTIYNEKKVQVNVHKGQECLSFHGSVEEDKRSEVCFFNCQNLLLKPILHNFHKVIEQFFWVTKMDLKEPLHSIEIKHWQDPKLSHNQWNVQILLFDQGICFCSVNTWWFFVHLYLFFMDWSPLYWLNILDITWPKLSNVSQNLSFSKIRLKM